MKVDCRGCRNCFPTLQIQEHREGMGYRRMINAGGYRLRPATLPGADTLGLVAHGPTHSTQDVDDPGTKCLMGMRRDNLTSRAAPSL